LFTKNIIFILSNISSYIINEYFGRKFIILYLLITPNGTTEFEKLYDIPVELPEESNLASINCVRHNSEIGVERL